MHLSRSASAKMIPGFFPPNWNTFYCLNQKREQHSSSYTSKYHISVTRRTVTISSNLCRTWIKNNLKSTAITCRLTVTSNESMWHLVTLTDCINRSLNQSVNQSYHLLQDQWFKQVAQLWQRDRAKLDTFAINVQRYSQTHVQNCIWGHHWGIRGNISTLCEIFYAKKLCSRVLSREYQFYS